MNKLTFGFALTGSFCTFDKAVEQIEKLVNNGINVLPIMSYNAYETDTRFGTAEYFKEKIEKIEETTKRPFTYLTHCDNIDKAGIPCEYQVKYTKFRRGKRNL